MNNLFIDNCGFLARYNRWMNQRLYAACEGLTDAQRKADQGAFFKSIHHTLTHLVLADKMWLARFAKQGIDFEALKPGLLAMPERSDYTSDAYSAWADLKQAREDIDITIEMWIAELPQAADTAQAYAASTMLYANTQGVQRAHPTWQALTHFFNHQTHHRGQVTTLLMQEGIDVGVTDLIALV